MDPQVKIKIEEKNLLEKLDMLPDGRNYVYGRRDEKLENGM